MKIIDKNTESISIMGILIMLTNLYREHLELISEVLQCNYICVLRTSTQELAGEYIKAINVVEELKKRMASLPLAAIQRDERQAQRLANEITLASSSIHRLYMTDIQDAPSNVRQKYYKETLKYVKNNLEQLNSFINVVHENVVSNEKRRESDTPISMAQKGTKKDMKAGDLVTINKVTFMVLCMVECTYDITPQHVAKVSSYFSMSGRLVNGSVPHYR